MVWCGKGPKPIRTKIDAYRIRDAYRCICALRALCAIVTLAWWWVLLVLRGMRRVVRRVVRAVSILVLVPVRMIRLLMLLGGYECLIRAHYTSPTCEHEGDDGKYTGDSCSVTMIDKE